MSKIKETGAAPGGVVDHGKSVGEKHNFVQTRPTGGGVGGGWPRA